MATATEVRRNGVTTRGDVIGHGRVLYRSARGPVHDVRAAAPSAAHKYHSSREFVADFELLLENCITYNGQESSFTEKAQALVDAVKATVEKVRAGPGHRGERSRGLWELGGRRLRKGCAYSEHDACACV